MSKFSQAAQAKNPTCPEGHPLTITDEEGYLFGTCATCGRSWRVMLDGSIIPDGHPLGMSS